MGYWRSPYRRLNVSDSRRPKRRVVAVLIAHRTPCSDFRLTSHVSHNRTERALQLASQHVVAGAAVLVLPRDESWKRFSNLYQHPRTRMVKAGTVSRMYTRLLSAFWRAKFRPKQNGQTTSFSKSFSGRSLSARSFGPGVLARPV